MDRKYRFAVKLCDSTKLISVADKRAVVKRAREVFGVGDEYAVEYHDAAFDVYIEPEVPEDFPDELGKLRLVRRCDPPAMVPARKTSIQETDCRPPSRSILEASTSSAGSSVPAGDVGEDSDLCSFASDSTLPVDPVVADPLSATVTASPTQNESECVQCFYDPMALTRNLRMRLDNGARKLKTGEMSQLLDAIHARYTNIRECDNPSKREYDKMVSDVLTRHPSLRGSLSLGEAMVWLKRLLRDKFRNRRAKVKRDRSMDESGVSPPEPKQRRVAGLKNYAPAVVASEVQQQRMMNELRNAAETAEERDAILQESFAGRRKAALGGANILQMYPRLLEDDGFHREVDRIAGSQDFVKEKTAEVSRHLEEIGRTLKTTNKDVTLRQLQGLLGVADAALEGDARTAFPHFEADDRVCAGSWHLASSGDRTEKIVLLVLAYSVLHMQFPRNANAFLSFVQLYLMEIDDGISVPQRALKIKQQLL